jgi:hypothetical protein
MDKSLIEQISESYDTSEVSLPNSMYVESGLEHQFAIELYMGNKGEMALKVLDGATSETYDKPGTPYYVYIQTNNNEFIDPYGIYDDEDELLQKYRMRQFRANKPVPSRLTIPKVVPLKNIENWRLKRFLSNSWWSDDPLERNTEIMEIDNWMEWFDEQEEGGGPIDEYVNKTDPFETDEEDVFDTMQKDSQICMACGELQSQCMQDEMQFGCKTYNKKKVKKNTCPCGCDGVIEDHDDRGYGQWACPKCGDDSDTNMMLECSYCTEGKKRAYGRRQTQLHKTPRPLPIIMRSYNHGTNNEKRGEWLDPRHNMERIRNIDGSRYQMLAAGGSGGRGSAYASQSTMRKRAAALRSKGYNARVIPMAGNADGKYALFLSKKVRFSDQERKNLARKGVDWRMMENKNR